MYVGHNEEEEEEEEKDNDNDSSKAVGRSQVVYVGSPAGTAARL